jgi:hypothetical protein
MLSENFSGSSQTSLPSNIGNDTQEASDNLESRFTEVTNAH